MNDMNENTSHNFIGAQNRLLRMVLTRFSTATGIMTTQPVIQYGSASQSVKVIVGYIPIGQTNGLNILSINLVNALADFLSHVMGLKVNLVLIRLGYPYADAGLMAQYLAGVIGGTSQSSHTFKAVMLRVVKFIAFATSGFATVQHPNAPIGMQGLRVRVSGRLTTEATRPRQTVQEFSMGSFGSNRIQAASFTSINAKGSLTVKVWMGL